MHIHNRLLTKEEKDRIVKRKFEDGLSFKKIAELYGVSVWRVRKIIYEERGYPKIKEKVGRPKERAKGME